MPKKALFIILCFTCISFMMTVPHPHAMTTMEDAGVLQKEDASTKVQSARTKPTAVATSDISVLNIVLTGIDNKNVYAADGRTFPISSKTKVIRNLGQSRIRIAELVFRGGTLISVVIK